MHTSLGHSKWRDESLRAAGLHWTCTQKTALRGTANGPGYWPFESVSLGGPLTSTSCEKTRDGCGIFPWSRSLSQKNLAKTHVWAKGQKLFCIQTKKYPKHEKTIKTSTNTSKNWRFWPASVFWKTAASSQKLCPSGGEASHPRTGPAGSDLAIWLVSKWVSGSGLCSVVLVYRFFSKHGRWPSYGVFL